MSTQLSINKNILDLKYNTYLQYFNTAIIIAFTYVIGIIIAIITYQIKEITQLLLVWIFSSIILFFIAVFLKKCRNNLKRILEEIKALSLSQSIKTCS